MEKDCKDCKKAIPHGNSGHEWECTAEEYDIEGKTCFEPKSESLDEVISNQDQQPVVSFFVHQADMMQKDADNERMHETYRKTIKTICATFIILIVIFVTAYTIRTAIWQNTILKMNAAVMEMASLHHRCVEVDHAEEADTP